MSFISPLVSFFTPAIAIAAEQPEAQNQVNHNPIMNMLPLVVIFVVFYFLMIRPQQKKSREFAAMLDSLKIGDKVATTGGIIGDVVGMDKDNNTVDLKVNDVSVILVYKRAITEILQDDKSNSHVRAKKA